MIVFFISYLLYFGDYYPREAILPEIPGIYYYRVGRSKRKQSKHNNSKGFQSRSKVKKSSRNYSTRDKMK